MFKKSHYVAFGLVVLLALIVLNLPGRTTARLKLAIGSLFLPLFGLASSAQQLADTGSGVILPRGELLRQNESLRRENEQLRLQAVQAGEIARENARLRQLFGWPQTSPVETQAGQRRSARPGQLVAHHSN